MTYTISERQHIKDRISDPQFFAADKQLFTRIFPQHPLQRELARANHVNKPALCRQMIYNLLARVSEEQIIANRNSNSGSEAATLEQATQETTVNRQEEQNTSSPRRTKQDEFPDIKWDDYLNPDIQLCKLLYDERVTTYHRLQEIDKVIDTKPELAAEMAALDDRNRLAHRELEVFQSTGIFPAEHPLAVQFLADRKTKNELLKLKQENPEAFLKHCKNVAQNISRIRSRINHHHYKDEQELAKWQRNLVAAEHLQELTQKILNNDRN